MGLSLAVLPYELFYRLGLYRLTWHDDEATPEIVAWRRAGKLAGSSALEVGAGGASNALWFARQGLSATAIDFSPRAVQIAKSRARRERLGLDARVVDVTRGDPSLGRFDIVADRECLQDLQRREARAAYARNILQWLAPGAAFVVATWVYRNDREARRRFPTARLAQDEVPRLFPELVVEECQVEERRLFGFSSAHATFLLRRQV